MIKTQCFHCHSKNSVVWDEDKTNEDYCFEPSGVVHECHCEECGALYIIFVPFDDEDDDEDDDEEDK